MEDGTPSDRQRLHRLIESIPEDRLAAAAAVLEPLADPVLHAFLNAPEDDEPLTPEEEAAVAEARAAVARGETVPWEQVRAELVGQD